MRLGVIKDTFLTIQFYRKIPFIMSKSIALSLLAQGSTGSEILQILDALMSDIESNELTESDDD